MVAGTEIPRSRTENANIITNLYNAGTLGDPNDLDVKEEYFRALDLPNYRAIISMLRQKQEEMSKRTPDFREVFSNPEMTKAYADIFKALTGFNKARGQLLAEIGLDPTPNT